MTESEHLAGLEEKTGHCFKDKRLLLNALTHSSYLNENRDEDGIRDYERLEFLGDAVLELVSSTFLYEKYPERSEGDLSRMRASLVCEGALSICAGELGLAGCIRLGRGERAHGGSAKSSILSDVVEALIGAIYLDSGRDLGEAERFIRHYVLKDVQGSAAVKDPKSMLQEYAQHNGLEVRYELLSEDGPAHSRIYTSAACLDGRAVSKGSGTSKKHSEQEAAVEALRVLGCI